MSANELVAVGGQMLPAAAAELLTAMNSEDAAMVTAAAYPVRMSTQGGMFSVGEDTLGEGPLYVWVVGKAYMRTYYDPVAAFSPGKQASPLCYSLMRNRSSAAVAVPHRDCVSPQAESCAVCPHNVWGSAVRNDGTPSRGKACGTRWRLGVVQAVGVGADGGGVWLPPDVIATSTLYQIDVTVTSGKACEEYFASMAARPGQPPRLPYVTAIRLVRDKQTQFRFEFVHGGLDADAAMLEALVPWYSRATDMLMRPFYKEKEAAPAGSGKY